jgi:hypothetical protein
MHYHLHEAGYCPECGYKLISAEEAAKIIGVSYPRIRAILSKQPERLHAFRIGKVWIIPERAALEFKPKPAHRPSKIDILE